MLRFNGVTRQSVALCDVAAGAGSAERRASPSAHDAAEHAPNRRVLQRPDCLAMEYLKTMVAQALALVPEAAGALQQPLRRHWPCERHPDLRSAARAQARLARACCFSAAAVAHCLSFSQTCGQTRRHVSFSLMRPSLPFDFLSVLTSAPPRIAGGHC